MPYDKYGNKIGDYDGEELPADELDPDLDVGKELKDVEEYVGEYDG